MAKHVVAVHMNAEHERREREGDLSLDFLKRYVMYARMNCAPRLNQQASEKLSSHYVKMRNPTEEDHENSKLLNLITYLTNSF